MSNYDNFRKELQQLEDELLFEDAFWAWNFDIDEVKFDFALIYFVNNSKWSISISKAEVEKSDSIEGLAKKTITNLYNWAVIDNYCYLHNKDCDNCVIQKWCDNFHDDATLTYDVTSEMAKAIKEVT